MRLRFARDPARPDRASGVYEANCDVMSHQIFLSIGTKTTVKLIVKAGVAKRESIGYDRPRELD